MIENPVSPAPAASAPAPGTSLPGDPRATAERAITAAVDRLEASRAGSLDDQLEAAEEVHATLSRHLSGGPETGPRPGVR